MKTKQKLVLSLAALSAITLGVGATSTFAWFTTTRTATVAVTNIGVYGNTGSLHIGYYGITNGNKTSVTDTTNEELKTNTSVSFAGIVGSMTPISGNGAQFYLPNWVPGRDGVLSSGNATSITGNPDASTSYLLQFGLVLSNTDSPNPLDVYFDYKTAITAGTSGTATKNAQAAKATRVAFFDFGTTKTTEIAHDATVAKYLVSNLDGTIDGKDDDNPYLYMDAETDYNTTLFPDTGFDSAHQGTTDPTPDTEGYDTKGAKYLNTTTFEVFTSDGTSYGTGVDYRNGEGGSGLASLAANNLIKSEIPTSNLATEPAAGSKLKLCTVAKDAKSYIGVSVWIDGASADCINDANTGHVNLDLHLAAF